MLPHAADLVTQVAQAAGPGAQRRQQPRARRWLRPVPIDHNHPPLRIRTRGRGGEGKGGEGGGGRDGESIICIVIIVLILHVAAEHAHTKRRPLCRHGGGVDDHDVRGVMVHDVRGPRGVCFLEHQGDAIGVPLQEADRALDDGAPSLPAECAAPPRIRRTMPPAIGNACGRRRGGASAESSDGTSLRPLAGRPNILRSRPGGRAHS